MDPAITVAFIAGAVSIFVAALSFWLTKRAERRDALQQRKLEHYRELLLAISDLAVDGVDKEEANRRFACAANIIVLVAPPKVINALMAFHDEVKFSKPNRSPAGHDKKLKELLVAIRWSLQLPFEDEPFEFHLIGSRPTKLNACAAANPASAFWLQSTRPVGWVAEFGSFADSGPGPEYLMETV